MKQQATINEKMLLEENEKLNSSLTVINQSYQQKSSQARPKPDVREHQRQIQQQNALFSDVIKQLKLQLEREGQSLKQQIGDQSEANSRKRIMVSAGSQTQVSLDQ